MATAAADRIRLDPLLQLIVVGLMCVGAVALYSATAGSEYFTRQLAFFALAFAAMIGIAYVPMQFMKWGAPLLYAAVLGLLVLTHFFGEESNNARRWLDLGVRIQPSEFMKIAAPLMLAWFYSLTDRSRLWQHVIAVGLLAVPCLLVIKQPDLGTALLIFVSGFAVIFLAGLSWWIIGVGAVAAAVATPIIWESVLKDYQRDRILTLFDPERDPLGSGYHTIQSAIAVGSGGLWGKGWEQGTQAQLGFLPERHTDFIFAVYAEEFGLVGCLLLLGLSLALVFRGLSIGWSAATKFEWLAASAIAVVYFFYVFVNLGMVSGILPVVGLPLPIISYGGTALMSVFVSLGILLAIARSNRRI